MSRRLVLCAALALCASMPAWAAAPGVPAAPRPATSAAAPAKLKSVTLHIFNRVFEGFHDKVVAVMNKDYRVGDTEFTFRIIRFEPDFTLDLKRHKVTSRSGEPNNPAIQIVVRRGGAVHDTSWAFFNMPPHFGVKQELAFVATRIEFLNRPTLASKDSIAMRIEGQGGAAH